MKKGHRGQTTVEFAFVGLMFFALFFGVFEVARFAFGVSAVSNAAREGARWAVAVQNIPQPHFAAARLQGQPARLAERGLRATPGDHSEANDYDDRGPKRLARVVPGDSDLGLSTGCRGPQLLHRVHAPKHLPAVLQLASS